MKNKKKKYYKIIYTLLKLAQQIQKGTFKQKNSKIVIQQIQEIISYIEELQKNIFFLEDYEAYLNHHLRKKVYNRINELERPYKTEEWMKEQDEYNKHICQLGNQIEALLRKIEKLEEEQGIEH